MRLAGRTFFRFSGAVLFSLLGLAAETGNHVPGRLIVAARSGIDSGAVERTLRLHRAAIHRSFPQLGFEVIQVPEESSEAILSSLRRSGLFRYVERDYYAHTGGSPNDPSFPSQWHLSAIRGPSAWNMTTGSSSVVVAVIDSGVDSKHPDLTSKLVPGWSFVYNSSDTTDTMGHGTAVSGTVAAATNNSVGVAGVSWASLIMPLGVVDTADFAPYSSIAAAIQYAADRGVRVINISIGGTSYSSMLQSAVDYAWSKGAVIFASAMNNSTSTPYYPAACNNVVAVSATDSTDQLASFSNYGNWISISAPGTDILTTVAGGSYGYWYGTSFSSPIAAGVAALMLSANPSLTNTALVTMLEQSADDLGTPGFDGSFGWGRVNAYKAVTAAVAAGAVPVTAAVAPQTVTLGAGQSQQFTAAVTGLANTAVTWSLNPAVGSLSGGIYIAPASIANAQTVTITATASNGTTTAAATVNLVPPPPAPSSFTPIRVNAGGGAYTDAQGRPWIADSGFSGGETWATGALIGNTTTPSLYQTCRYGVFSYTYAVPTGTYTVTLKFAEISQSAPGQRVFSVMINGSVALANFDVFAQAGGQNIALDKSFTVTASNGQIQIQFLNGPANSPLVNGLEIVSTTAQPPAIFNPIRVRAGGPAYVDPQGRTWAADTSFSGGDSWSTGAVIANTSAPPLYQTCRYGVFNYQFSVPNGTYTVNLKFAEISQMAPGQRVFNVIINGTAVLTNFDIFAQAGQNTALDKSFTVPVANGQIQIQFQNGTANSPLIGAIEILGS